MYEDTRTVWCGNLHDKVTEDLLYELFMQGGPIEKVNIPKDRDGKQKSFGFITYKHECSVPYALELFDGTRLFNRLLNMQTRNNSVESTIYNANQQGNNVFERQRNIQNEVQLGHQILLGSISSASFAQTVVNMMPGGHMYPSQTSNYSQNPLNNPDFGRGYNRQQNRNHPYQEREHFNDRRNNRQESFNRNDHKPHKYPSHRSNRNDRRRKFH